MGRAGLNRKTAYATVTATLAAEAADLDVLWYWAGPVEGLEHHRGITHTFLAAPLVAAAVVGAVFLWTRWRKTAQNTLPVRWGWLYATALLAALSHLLLDWTNNYGLRPFYPFNAHWFAGSLVFIAEPALWALLAAAFVGPWLFGLIDGEIGARRRGLRGQGWAIFALAGMAALWGSRWVERTAAEALLEQTQWTAEPAKRMDLEPYPVNPFRWHAIAETASGFQRGEVNLLRNEVASDPRQDAFYKPTTTPASIVARQSALGRVYMDWGRWAVVRDLGPMPVEGMEPPELPKGRSWTTVEFTDLRFDSLRRRAGGGSPMSGWVYVVDGREVAGEAMGRRAER